MKHGIILAVAAVLLTAGCRTSVNTVESADKAGIVQPVRDKRVVTDPSMAHRVNVTAIIERTAANGFRQIQVQYTNFRNSEQTVFVSVEWVDATGMRVTTAGGGWMQQQFMARESRFILYTAPTPTAKDFTIKLIANPNDEYRMFN